MVLNGHVEVGLKSENRLKKSEKKTKIENRSENNLTLVKICEKGQKVFEFVELHKCISLIL